MQINVKTRHGHAGDSVKQYAEDKLGKLARRVHDLTTIDVTLSRSHNPSVADDHEAEAIVYAKGPNIVAREAAPSWEVAIDRLVDKLERQVERQRDMKTHERHRRAPREQAISPTDTDGDIAADGAEAGAGSEESAA